MTDKIHDNNAAGRERGRYDSPLPEFPGHFQLPAAMPGRMYKAWHRALYTGDDGGTPDRSDPEQTGFFREWRAAVALLEFADAWEIKGVPRANIDPSGDSVPVIVMRWVTECAASYVQENNDLGNWRGRSVTT